MTLKTKAILKYESVSNLKVKVYLSGLIVYLSGLIVYLSGLIVYLSGLITSTIPSSHSSVVFLMVLLAVTLLWRLNL